MSKFKTVSYQITFDIALPLSHSPDIKNDIAHATAKAVDEVLRNCRLTHAGIATSHEENDE